MSPALTCLALALLGVDLGYRPAPNGGAEFIIQISPATLQALRPGEPIDIDVPREAQGLRPSHFTVSLGNERLPRTLPTAELTPPARAPTGPANPELPAVAMSTPPPYIPPGEGPVVTPPPSSVLPEQTGARPAMPASATSAEQKFGGLAPVSSNGGNSSQSDKPWWLLMCLLVIALSASNSYVGWLFYDARQRYRALLARTFSVAERGAEA